MALAKVKTNMRGTGGGRWTTRASAKTGARKGRRTEDRKAVCDLCHDHYVKSPHECCYCGSASPAEPPGPGCWPSCPDCGGV